MDWNLILPWLIAGLAIGWFIEFLIDYFFWRRKCEASTASANAELSTLRGSIKGIEAELAGAQSTRASLEASVGDIQGKYNDVMGRVGLLAGAGGALGAIGGWLGRGGNDNEFKAQIADVNASLKAKSELETQVGELSAKLSSANVDVSAELEKELGELHEQLKAERNAKADLESRIDQLQANIKANPDLDIELYKLRTELETERQAKAALETRLQTVASARGGITDNRLGLLAGAGGLAASLGAAFQSDDDAELEMRVNELNAQLAVKDELEKELGQLRGQLDAERNAKAEFEARINSLEGELHTRNEATNTLEAELGQLRGQLDAERNAKTEFEERINELQRQVDANNNLEAELDAELSSLRGQLDAERSTKLELENDIERLQSDLSANAEVVFELGQLRDELDTARNAKAELESRISNLEGELNSKVEAGNNLEVELSELRSQLNEERDAKANLEGQINLMHGQLEAERQAKAEVEKVDTSRTLNRFNMLAGTGGLVAGLGAAFHADDDSELEGRLQELETELQAKEELEDQLRTVQSELDAAQSVANEYDSEINELKATNAELAHQLSEVPSFKWVDAKDDLKLINGIGPVMERRLNQAGITTYAQIANTDPAELYRIAEAKEWQKVNTADWITQARGMKSSGKVMMLADGTTVGREDDELRQSLNDAVAEVARLKAEARAKPKTPRQSPDRKLKAQLDAASAEIQSLRSRSVRRGRDLLQAIDGIDATIENRFYDNEITTYLELSEHGDDSLRTIAQVEEDVNTTLWIRQANEILASQRRGYNRLQDINGIDEAYQARLFDNGYYTYYDIANATEDELHNAIDVEGETVRANCRSWIQQANEIVGGTFITGTRGRIGAGGWAVDQTHNDERDRLININGVGPIYQRRLYAAGIYTFGQLIAATNETLGEVCRIQEWQEVDLDEWKAQARQLAQAK